MILRSRFSNRLSRDRSLGEELDVHTDYRKVRIRERLKGSIIQLSRRIATEKILRREAG